MKKARKMLTILGIILTLNQIDVYATEPNELDENLLQCYYQCNWQEYDMEKRKELNMILTEEIAHNLKIETPNIIYYSDEDILLRGKYYVGTNDIHINEEIMYSSQYTFKAIAHEIRHVWQYKQTLEQSNEQGKEFTTNYSNYVTSESDYAAYQAQTIEKDADYYADTVYMQLIQSSK